MARIIVTTFGSTGDLNPFVALGLALRSKGHDVLFAIEANFQQQVSLLGFPVLVLTGDQAEALGPSILSKVTTWGLKSLKSKRQECTQSRLVAASRF